MRLVEFVALFVCSVLIAYSFMLVLTSFSVWLVRNQSLMEMWWLFGTLVRYPREIFLSHPWAAPLGVVFSTLVPIMLATNVPAEIIAKRVFDPLAMTLRVAASQ